MTDGDAFFDVFDGEASASGEYFTVAIYDISDNRRRNKMNTLLESYGVRVQRSAFECYLTKGEISEVVKKAAMIIDAAEDSFKLYRMNKNDSVETCGISGVAEERRFVVI